MPIRNPVVQIALLLVLLLTLSVPARAGLYEQVARDFQPLSGYVVMAEGEEFLVDLDAAAGLRIGDLLRVVIPGEKITHPVTGEVLGILDVEKGVLRVTQVKEGYSHAHPLSGPGEIKRGDQVRRFEQIPAFFRDQTGEGEKVYLELKNALPGLGWQGYVSGDAGEPAKLETGLVFVLKEGGLEVHGADFELLRCYALPNAGGRALVKAEIPPPSADVVSRPASTIVRRDLSSSEDLWFGPDMPGVPVGLEVGDLDGEEKLEVAVAFPHRLEIARLEERTYEPLATVDFGFGQKALSLDGADLDGDGRMELYVTAASDGDLRSLVVRYHDGKYEIDEEGVPFYFRRVALPEEGPVLLAQRIGTQENEFSGPVFRVGLEGKDLVEGKPVPVPDGADLYGFMPLDNGESLFANLSEYDRLQVLQADGTLLWQSEDRFGGTEAYFERIDPQKNPVSGDNLRHVYLQKRIEPGEDGELLIPVNEGSRLFSRGRNFNRSFLRAMAWNGHTLQEVWSTRPQEGYLADFRMADVDNDGMREMVQVLAFTRGGFLKKGRSSLAVFELR